MELGIAGVPADVASVAVCCGRLGLEPLFLLWPDDGAAISAPYHTLRLTEDEPEACLAALRGRRLAGLWAASHKRRGAVASVAARLNLPHLPCPRDPCPVAAGITGARQLDLAALESLSEADRATISLPAWVRASCGSGDSSCMRLDHVSELSLATVKLKKRGVLGPVRVQPVLDGPIYRLLAFKTGRAITPFDIVHEDTTTSMFRVPLSLSMPVPRRGALLGAILQQAQAINKLLPTGWGYLELEFVVTGDGPHLADIQCPAALDPLLADVVLRSQGVDLLQAALQCAAGRPPLLTPTRETGVAMSWLLTRSGVVTGFQGVEEARAMPGIEAVAITAKAGDELTHVVDVHTRDRGGYIIATGATAAVARERLEAARERIGIVTSPVRA